MYFYLLKLWKSLVGSILTTYTKILTVLTFLCKLISFKVQNLPDHFLENKSSNLLMHEEAGTNRHNSTRVFASPIQANLSPAATKKNVLIKKRGIKVSSNGTGATVFVSVAAVRALFWIEVIIFCRSFLVFTFFIIVITFVKHEIIRLKIHLIGQYQ